MHRNWYFLIIFYLYWMARNRGFCGKSLIKEKSCHIIIIVITLKTSAKHENDLKRDRERKTSRFVIFSVPFAIGDEFCWRKSESLQDRILINYIMVVGRTSSGAYAVMLDMIIIRRLK